IVVVWELTDTGRGREHRALRLIGAAFFALALYILAQSACTLANQLHPGTSGLGIAWLISTATAMWLLAWGQHRRGRQLGNRALMTEARVTVIDGALAAAVLAGLLLNALFGLWWADPVAGLVIVYSGLKEGWHAWHEPAA